MDNPKCYYNPNDLYYCISKKEQERYYKKKTNEPGAPLLKDKQRRIRHYCRMKSCL